MKKLIRLTESELKGIIQKVINEQAWSDPAQYAQQVQKNKPEPKPAEKVDLKPIGTDVKATQDFLMALGYDLGPKGADGYMGPYTQKAIEKFQEDNNKLPTGKLTLDQYKLLQTKANEAGKMPKTDKVREYQQALVNKGYKIKVDGLHGPQTAAAVKDFQSKYPQLKPTGYFDNATVKQLLQPQGTGKGMLAPPSSKAPAAQKTAAVPTKKTSTIQPPAVNQFM